MHSHRLIPCETMQSSNLSNVFVLMVEEFFFLPYTTKWKLYSSFVKVWIFFPFQLQIVCPMLKFSILGKPFHARGEDKRRTHEKTFCQFFSSVPLPLLHIFAIVKINHWNKNSEIRKFFRLTFQRLFVTTFHYIIWLTQHGVIQFISFSRKSNSDTYGFGHVLCTHFFAPPSCIFSLIAPSHRRLVSHFLHSQRFVFRSLLVLWKIIWFVKVRKINLN